MSWTVGRRVRHRQTSGRRTPRSRGGSPCRRSMRTTPRARLPVAGVRRWPDRSVPGPGPGPRGVLGQALSGQVVAVSERFQHRGCSGDGQPGLAHAQPVVRLDGQPVRRRDRLPRRWQRLPARRVGGHPAPRPHPGRSTSEVKVHTPVLDRSGGRGPAICDTRVVKGAGRTRTVRIFDHGGKQGLSGATLLATFPAMRSARARSQLWACQDQCASEATAGSCTFMRELILRPATEGG